MSKKQLWCLRFQLYLLSVLCLCSISLNNTAIPVLTNSSKTSFILNEMDCRIPQVSCMLTQLQHSGGRMHVIQLCHFISSLIMVFQSNIVHCTSNRLVALQFSFSSLYQHSSLVVIHCIFKLYQLLNLNTTVFIIYKTSFVPTSY